MELTAIRVYMMPAFPPPRTRRLCANRDRIVKDKDHAYPRISREVLRGCYAFELHLCECIVKVGNSQRRKHVALPSALPETAISVAVAATAVGAAATFLARRTKSPETIEVPTKTCEDCGGSGVCPECKGEGFVLRRPSDENAERARLNSKTLATRYTAGLPKKWSYCMKCSSSRSCITCEGRGKLTSEQ